LLAFLRNTATNVSTSPNVPENELLKLFAKAMA
jgi:hypothetical protein